MKAPTNAIERKEAFKEWSKNLKYGSDNWDENLWDQIDGMMGPGYKSTYSSIWRIKDINEIEKIWNKVPRRSTPGTPNYIKGNSSGAVKAKIAQYKAMLESITAKGDAFMDDAPSASSPGAAGSSTASVAASDPTSLSSMDSLSEIAQKCKTLLESNHNIILSGAPGTGKTYMAKQIALAMTGSEDRIGFVQFHPSYDYTDFVEGLRPTSASGSTIGFERKDGIFKEFCDKALFPSVSEIYKSLVDDIKKGSLTSLPLKTKGVSMNASVSTQDNIILLTHSSAKPYTVSLKDILKLSEVYPDKVSLDNMKNIDKEIRSVLGGRHVPSIWAVIYEIYKRIESASSTIINNKGTDGEEKARYVFIIDEINRGEMSKVFGELFFSIDPGYRGESGAVRTQYANMVTTPNAFDKVLRKSDPKDCGHFFVPENVYIIGTMNDIDRSVDSMDFAMRRRFLIKDIKAEDTQEDMLKLETIKDIYPSITAIEPKVVDKMNALNKVIEGKSIKAKLGSSYSLGASYFQKYYKYNDFKLLWEYHLEGILREYLRGTQDPDSDLKVLKEAYENA